MAPPPPPPPATGNVCGCRTRDCGLAVVDLSHHGVRLAKKSSTCKRRLVEIACTATRFLSPELLGRLLCRGRGTPPPPMHTQTHTIHMRKDRGPFPSPHLLIFLQSDYSCPASLRLNTCSMAQFTHANQAFSYMRVAIAPFTTHALHMASAASPPRLPMYSPSSRPPRSSETICMRMSSLPSCADRHRRTTYHLHDNARAQAK